MISLRTFIRDERGSTEIEYAMIATLIAVLLVAALSSIGRTMNTKYFQPIAAGIT